MDLDIDRGVELFPDGRRRVWEADKELWFSAEATEQEVRQGVAKIFTPEPKPRGMLSIFNRK